MTNLNLKLISLTNYKCLGIRLQLSEHFTYPNTLWSQRVRINDFLLYIRCSSVLNILTNNEAISCTAIRLSLISGMS